jgi:hypothetical protein
MKTFIYFNFRLRQFCYQLFLTASVATLVGCTALWSGGYQVQERTKDRFEVWYDPLLASQAMIQSEAKEHCEKYNATPKIVSATSGYGVVSNKEVYRCISK